MCKNHQAIPGKPRLIIIQSAGKPCQPGALRDSNIFQLFLFLRAIEKPWKWYPSWFIYYIFCKRVLLSYVFFPRGSRTSHSARDSQIAVPSNLRAAAEVARPVRGNRCQETIRRSVAAEFEVLFLVDGFKHLLFSIISIMYGIILPIDFYIFQDG